MSWRDLEDRAPEIATLAVEHFERTSMALIGTIRRDGSPRISCVYPLILAGELYLGMMWRSRKAVDLLRDPRLVLHNAIWTNRGDEVEVILRGEAIDVQDSATRSRYVAAVPSWDNRRFHLFLVELASAAVVRYESGRQHVLVWPRGIDFQRRY